MPPSRIAFALADLASEIEALGPRDDQSEIEVVVDAPVYQRVRAALESHLGRPGAADSLKCGGVTLRCRDA